MHRKSAHFLFLAVLGMLVIGIVMLFSTSAFARDAHGDVYFFIKRQAIWLGIGLTACMVATLVDYHFWQRTWWLWFAGALGTLALCFVPHLGMRINGSRRWVGAGPITFQPSEIAKIAVVFFSSLVVCAFRETERELDLRFRYSPRFHRAGCFADHHGGGSGHDCTHRRDHLCHHVRRRDKLNFAWRIVEQWAGGTALRRFMDAGANEPAAGIHASGKLQAGGGSAANAGPNRLG